MTNFYFWLGEDGEVEDLIEDEFNARIEKIRKAQKDWENVVDEGIIGG